MKRMKRRWRISQRTRRVVVCGAILCGLFVVANGVLWLFYRERTYPNTSLLGVSISSVSYDRLAQIIEGERLLPETVLLQHGQSVTEVKLAELGIQKDISRSLHSAHEQRAGLPVLNLLRGSVLRAPVRVNEQQFSEKTAELVKAVHKKPVNARLAIEADTVNIVAEANGYVLIPSQLQQRILQSLDKGWRELAAPTQQTKPTIHSYDLKKAQKALQAQLKTKVVLSYGGKNRQASPEEVGQWLVQSGAIYTLDAVRIQAYVRAVGKEFGIHAQDVPGVAARIVQAVASQKAFGSALAAQPAAKTFSYCAATKGVEASYLPALRGKLQDTLGDARGWSLDGTIEFKEAGAGCNFTVWLSASALMPTFGPICDSLWSCRSGSNVVINFDRWQNASTAWTTSGGSLEDYRSMVINHETGHWLGFGHLHCPGTGQPAPVMQQQSINLEGCQFNAWPTPSELATLRRLHNL